MTRSHSLVPCAAATLLLLLGAAPKVASQPPALPDFPMLPRELEIELALNAAPKHLRDSATVLVLDATGYVEARKGTNAFTCEVARRGGDVFPVCWDAEGAKTMLTLDVDAAKMRLAGRSNAEIDKTIADGFASGRYRPPSRAGVAYMLSPVRYRIDAKGTVTPSPPLPHTMFYGPGLTDADVGGQRGTILFMNKTGPDGMIIVPVGTTEKAAIVAETKSLAERVERAIGYAPRSK